MLVILYDLLIVIGLCGYYYILTIEIPSKLFKKSSSKAVALYWILGMIATVLLCLHHLYLMGVV